LLRIITTLMAVALCALFLACGDDNDAESTPTPTEAVTGDEETASASAPAIDAIVVTMGDDEMVVDADSGPAGPLTFEVTNDGTDERPFQIIITTDEAEVPLPTTSAGEFDPAGGDAYIVAQTPGMGAGSTTTIGSDLEAGNYVLIAGGVDADGNGHYGKGVFAEFTVE
jgi:hypothetical protein